MSEKSAHSHWRDWDLYLWNTHPLCFPLHHESRRASHQFKQTPQTLTHQLHRETQACIMKDSDSYMRDRDSHQVSPGHPLSQIRCVRERRTIELTALAKKSAHSPRRDSNLTSGIAPIVHALVCASQWKNVADEWRAWQEIPAILQVAAAVCVCVCLFIFVCVFVCLWERERECTCAHILFLNSKALELNTIWRGQKLL